MPKIFMNTDEISLVEKDIFYLITHEHVCRCLRKAGEGIRPSESGATGGCEPSGCREPNSSPLREQEVLSG